MAAVVKLRGLPYSCNERQIVDFFRPVPVGVESVTLTCNPDGRASGEGFVWIHENNMGQALNYNKKHLGPRYIEVYESNEDEYYAAIEGKGGAGPNVKPIAAPRPSATIRGAKGGARGATPTEPCTEPVLRVRGLPYSATVDELVNLFADYGLVDDNVCIGVCPGGPQQGRPNGDAILRFDTLKQAQGALQNIQGATVGNRYLELFPCTESELEQKANQGAIAGYEANASSNGDINPQKNRPNSGWIRLRGLPYTASLDDIIEFCGEGLGVSQNDVTIKHGTDGRPSGEAFIQLDSNAVAEEACQTLDRQNMGSRYIEVLMSSHAESMATRSNERAGPYSRPGGFGGGMGKGRGKW